MPRGNGSGQLVARVLSGAWHTAPPPLDLPAAALDVVAPLLHKSGAAALAWWRLRGTPLADTPAGDGFHQAYRLHALEAEVHALKIAAVLDRLEESRVDALVVKGWAIARRYPEAGLRPYTDLDLIVRPGQLLAARAALATLRSLAYRVDLPHGPSNPPPPRFTTPPNPARRAGRLAPGPGGSSPDPRASRASPCPVPAELARRPGGGRREPAPDVRLGALPRLRSPPGGLGRLHGGAHAPAARRHHRGH